MYLHRISSMATRSNSSVWDTLNDYRFSFVIYVFMFPGNDDDKVQVNDEKNKLLFELKTKQVHTLTVANKSLVFIYTAHIMLRTLLSLFNHYRSLLMFFIH